MNDCTFVGNLTREPVVKATQTGKAVAGFTIAADESYTTQQGETKEFTSYINVVAWGYLAEAAGNQLHKGMRVMVHGRQSTRSYNGNDGQKRWTTEITADTIALPLSTKSRQNAAPTQQGYQNVPAPVQQAQGNPGWDQFGHATPQSTDMFGEEIPF